MGTTVEDVAKKIEQEAKEDTVIECRIRSDGSMCWRIPPDIKQATFMLKVLDIAVSQMLKMALQVKQPSIVRPINKIIKPS